eukprot:s379_g11.t1
MPGLSTPQHVACELCFSCQSPRSCALMRLVLLSLAAILASAVREAEKLEAVQKDLALDVGSASKRETSQPSRILPDHYQLLNVSRFASAAEMKKSYHKLAMKYHPDRNFGNEGEAEAKFKDLEAAFAILSDAAKREAYDSSHPEAGTEPYNPCAAVVCPKHARCKQNQLDEPYCKCRRRYTLSKNECLTKLQRTVSTACCMEEDEKLWLVPPEYLPGETNEIDLSKVDCPGTMKKVDKGECMAGAGAEEYSE